MLYDRRDFGLLRLAGTYQWLPLAPLRALSSLKHLYREAELLSTLGLLSFSRSNQYLMPSPEGYQFLASMEIDCHAPTKRPYAQSSALRRRLEVGTVLLTCLGAGIEPAYDKVDRLKRQPVFLPAFALRGGDGNLMNAASCVGFGHWGNHAYLQMCIRDSARVARKIDGIVARMGLNPALTGDGLGRGLPGMVAYAVVKGIGSSIAKAAGNSVGNKSRKGGSSGGSSSEPRTNPRTPPPPPSGGSPGGAGASPGAASAGQQAGTQTDPRSPSAQGGVYASKQTVQGVSPKMDEAPPEGSHAAGVRCV